MNSRDKAAALVGRCVRFNHQDFVAGTVTRANRGMVEIEGFSGEFAPELFVIVDDASNIPIPPGLEFAFEGHRWKWIPEGDDWKIADLERTCQRRMNGKRCQHQAVVSFRRKHGKTFRWWFYCASHMYGRAIENGLVKSLRLVKDFSGGQFE